ncbi:MAG: vitamin K epoxide reductase family protein [Mangrovibacterium sp.]
MSINSEDNTVYVLQSAARKLKIRVTKSSIREFLLAHPHYPTLKSICDALQEWHVSHYPLRLESAEIKELQVPFIAHLNVSGGQLVFVEKIQDSRVFYQAYAGKTQKELFETFAVKLSGAVILMEADSHSGERQYRDNRQNEVLNRMLLPLGITTILLLLFFNLFLNSGGSIFQFQTMGWALAITKLAGITACIFLILKELKIANKLTQKICSFSTKTDCDTVLSSGASRLFGWTTWADAGLIYFTGTLVYLFGTTGDTSLNVLALISFFSLPYPLFSIWYQGIKLKKWCPFCLAVQIILIVEFVLLYPQLKSFSVNGTDILRFLASVITPMVIWMLFKDRYNQFEKQEKEHVSYLKIKRNPAVFRFLLTQSGHVDFEGLDDTLVLGNENAPVRLTAFLSLYCDPCARAFRQLKVLLDSCPEIRVNPVFSIYSDEETLKVMNVLYYCYQTKGSKAAIEFLDQWYSRQKISRKKLYDQVILPTDFNPAEQLGKKNAQLFEAYKVEGTPTIYISGYKFPSQYELNDLKQFTDELKTLTMESKRQEAYAN